MRNMRAAKNKKSASWWAKNKFIVLVVAACLVAFVLFGFLYYQSQRPNYRDLEKEFSNLQIPSNWQLVSESSSKGWMGLFCFTSGIDEACPYKDVLFSLSSDEKNSQSDIAFLSQIESTGGFSNVDKNLANCSKNVENYYCIYFAEKGKIKLRLSIDSSDENKKLTIRLE